jgi:hypothetical protein
VVYLYLVRPQSGTVKTTILLTLLTALLVIPVVGGAEPQGGVPRDFRVTIHDYPGLSDWKPFETTVMADGTGFADGVRRGAPETKAFQDCP